MRAEPATPPLATALARAVRQCFAAQVALVLASLAASVPARAGEPSRWPLTAPPPLSLPALDGAAPGLQSLRGKVVVIHFFATWCEPCQTGLRDLDGLQARHGDRLIVLAVDVGEPRARTEKYFAASPVRFPILLDLDKAAMKAWAVDALPTSFVLGAGLCPLWKSEGAADWTAPAVMSSLLAALQSAQAPQSRCPSPGENP